MSKDEIIADLPGPEPAPIKVEDRRFWVRARDSAEADQPELGERRLPTYVEQLQEQLEAARQKLEEARAALRRVQQEADESRQRILRDVEARAQRKAAGLLAPILEAIDGIDFALRTARSAASSEGLLAGLELVRSQLGSRLLELGLERVPTVGAEFDPTIHEAVTTVPVSEAGQAGRVIEEVQAGYRLGETLVRPARVTVGQEPAGP
jgi:molecular chaperone GrpE